MKTKSTPKRKKLRTAAKTPPAVKPKSIKRPLGRADKGKARSSGTQAKRPIDVHLRSLLQTIPDVVYFKDAEGRNLIVNKAFEKRAGRNSKDIIGRTDDELLPPEMAAKCRASDEAAMKSRVPVRFEEDSAGPDGTLRFYETIKSAIFDDQGKALGLVGVSRDTTERKRMEDALRQSLQEKEVLLKEMHHRVKNNMQIISSILNLQAGSVKDPAALECLRESQRRIRSMALVHEKLYRSSDFSRIDFGEYVRSLVTALFQSCRTDSNRVRLDCKAEDVFLDINTAIPCGLVANELIVNALKHAFPEGRSGVIKTRLRPLGKDEYRFVISDNGVGFPKDLDFRNTESLGMQLVTLLVGQLDGTIDLKRKGGTTFDIVFKERKKKK